MDRVGYAYAFAQALCAEGMSYLDCFEALVLQALPYDGQSMTPENLHSEIPKHIGLSVPLYTLRAIVDGAVQKGLADRQGDRVSLSERGQRRAATLTSERDVERRVNALLDDATTTINDWRQTPVTCSEVYESLISLIHLNLASFLDFFGDEHVKPVKPVKPRVRSELHKDLFDYIKVAESCRPEQYRILREIFLGSLIAAMFNRNVSKRVQTTGRANRCIAYLDTNFLFSLFGFDEGYRNLASKEALELMTKHGWRPRVFDFTIEEVRKVIAGYPSQMHLYPTSVRVSSIYSTLRRIGWKKGDAYEFVANVCDRTKSLGIAIEDTHVLDLDAYTEPTSEMRQAIAVYKPEQSMFHQSHDLAAVLTVKQQRKRAVFTFDGLSHVLVTSDARLARYSHEQMGHSGKGSIAEAVLDSLLTNILWLKQPDASISLTALVATFAEESVVSRLVWRRFSEALCRIHAQGIVPEGKIEPLFYHHFIEKKLAGFADEDADSVDENFILAAIEEAALQAERRQEDTREEYLTEIAEQVSHAERRVDAEWQSWLQEVVSGESKKRASTVATLVAGIVAVGFAAVYVLVQSVSAGLQPIGHLVNYLVTSGLQVLVLTKMREWLERLLRRRLEERRYHERRRLSASS